MGIITQRRTEKAPSEENKYKIDESLFLIIYYIFTNKVAHELLGEASHSFPAA